MTFLKRVPAFLAYGQFGQIAILDCMLLAPLGVMPLAAVGFAGSVLAPFFIFTLGIALALAPLVAREEPAHGRATRLVECLRAQGAIAAVSVVMLLLLARGLHVFHQPEAVTQAARPHLYGMMVAMAPLVVFGALREWAIALGRPGAPVVFAITAIVLKIGVGLCLVRGIGPLPALGVLGASVSTVIAYGTATLLLVLDLARHGLFAGLRQASTSRLPPFLRSELLGQGLPVSLQQLTEVGALYITGIMAGWISADAVAAHSVAVNLINGAGLVSLALAQGAAVEVGKTAREGHAGIVGVSWRCALLALGIMALIAVPVLLGRGTLFAATSATSALALVVVIALLADGVQMTLGGALRGLVDARFLAIVTFGCWFFFCVPLSYALAFVLRLGILGIWSSLAATSFLAVIVLALRLHHLARFRSPACEVAS